MVLRVPARLVELVALLDEQPLVALVVLERPRRGIVGLAPAAAGPDDREAALHLLAVEDELQLAVLDGRRGSRVGASGSQVPQSQTITSPAPYCFDGMTPSKSKYSIGWSSTWTAIRRTVEIEGQALGDGPADEDALDLEPEVVVEPGRAMALDDEPPGRARDGGRCRLGGLPEVAFAAIFLERHGVSLT